MRPHILEAFDSDQLHALHSRPAAIGKDFFLERLQNGDWSTVLVVDSMKAYTGATQPEVALWKAREGLYQVISKVYAAKTIEEVHDILKHSRLDLSKLNLGVTGIDGGK